ncbi:Integrase catalytic domain-containing protein [Citrus sinensis]|nr:Integrase catalytic domain-containing protein [Citrus sinensis]
MEQNESVYSMYTRFTDIVNALGALEKTFSNSEKVKKIIRSLPKELRPKRTTIEEAKDLNALPLDDLIGSLISYEENLAAEKGHEEKKKIIALKASKYESDGESEPDDEELAMLARRFKKFFKKTGERRNFRNFKNQKEKKEVITCYECKKPSHIRSECPLINKLKKKAMVSTWDDSEEDLSDEEGSQEVSNLALMAIGGDDDLNEDRARSWLNTLPVNSIALWEQMLQADNFQQRSRSLRNTRRIKGVNEVHIGESTSGIKEIKEMVEGLARQIASLSTAKSTEPHDHDSYSDQANAIRGSQVLGIIPRALKPLGSLSDPSTGEELVVSGDLSTLEALITLASWAHLHIHQKPIGLLNVNNFYDGFITFLNHAIKNYFVPSNVKKLFICAHTANELLNMLQAYKPEPDLWTFVLERPNNDGNSSRINKDDALDDFKVLCKKLQNEKGDGIACIRSDRGGEFENHAFENFCNNLGIEHQFSSPRTPQQNGVVERKNRSIQEMARAMLNENSLPKYLWAEAVNTACYVLNRVLIRSNLNKTPYELWKHRKPNIGYFKVFGCKCFILNTKDNLGKFDPKSNVGVFLGYSNLSKAYRVYNKNTVVVEESMHVTFDESNPSSTEKVVVDNDVDEDLQKESSKDNQKDMSHGNQDGQHEEMNVQQNEGASQSLPKEWRYVSSHPKDVILGDPSRDVTIRSLLRNTCEHNTFISQIEPKSFADVENDESWIMAMQ